MIVSSLATDTVPQNMQPVAFQQPSQQPGYPVVLSLPLHWGLQTTLTSQGLHSKTLTAGFLPPGFLKGNSLLNQYLLPRSSWPL